MKKRTIGILATSVAVCALCIVTDASAIAGGGHGGGGGGGHGGGGGGHGGGGFAGGFHGGGGGWHVLRLAQRRAEGEVQHGGPTAEGYFASGTSERWPAITETPL